MTLSKWGLLVALAAFLAVRPASAQDLAAEADLHFRIGAERYQAGDYRAALEHFLLSNRLVPNRNVVFNVARTYEQLRDFTLAYQSYVQALEGETDAAVRGRLEAAIARITPNVAILRVATEPPGATVYVDRRDLGPRGKTPRLLAVAAGAHRVFVELEGHEPAQSENIQAVVGREVRVDLRLRRILGRVRVEGEPQGAQVRVDDEGATPLCRLPCDEPLPPGRHLLFVTLDGYETGTQAVDVRTDETSVVRVTLRPVTGTLVVDATEPDALVEVDGRSAGFTPTVLNVPVGQRVVRVALSGFRAVEQTVVVRANETTRVRAALEAVQEVTAASRAEETVEEAPASVTIVPRAEIDAMAYPTVVEAVRGVRGVYTWDDRAYPAVAFRGLGRLGDYGNRVLVLVDGHPINDNILGSSYVGYDLRTDLADVERIEVVRGPGSVLYGTGAFSGVINLVTWRRGTPSGADVGLSTNEYGVARARGGGRLRLNESSGLRISVAGARGEGRDFYFREFDDPLAGTDGHARGLDGFEAGTIAANAYYGDLSLQTSLHSREKDLATAPYDTLFAVPGTFQTDTRGLAELRYEPKIGRHLQLFARVFGNYYKFRGAFVYDDYYGGFDVYRERYTGIWGGGELRAVASPTRSLTLTIGGEVQENPRAELFGQSGVSGVYLDRNEPNRLAAGYLLADLTPASGFRFSGGARLDSYSRFGNAVSPRAAIIVRPWEGGNVKLMGGSAFRAPSIYELYYEDDGVTQIAPTSLDPETIYTGELELSQRLARRWTGLISGFSSYAKDLVTFREVEPDVNQFVNSDLPIWTIGSEVEVRRDWNRGWMVSGSYSLQQSRYVEGPSLRRASDREVENSPVHLAGIRGVAPVAEEALGIGTRLSLEGPRYDRYDSDDDIEDQQRTDAALIWDVVLSGRAERWHLTYAAGLYNAFDWRYAVPVSADYLQRTVPQNGRTVLLSASLSY